MNQNIKYSSWVLNNEIDKLMQWFDIQLSTSYTTRDAYSLSMSISCHKLSFHYLGLFYVLEKYRFEHFV